MKNTNGRIEYKESVYSYDANDRYGNIIILKDGIFHAKIPYDSAKSAEEQVIQFLKK